MRNSDSYEIKMHGLYLTGSTCLLKMSLHVLMKRRIHFNEIIYTFIITPRVKRKGRESCKLDTSGQVYHLLESK